MPQNARLYQAANGRVRSAKGERTVNSIIQAAIRIIDEDGFIMASQENIAKGAKISQSTLRHYFPTKEELIREVFFHSFAGFRHSAEKILLEPISDPMIRIERLVGFHLDFIMDSKDSYIFETFAYLARNPEERMMSDEWYQWLLRHYASLIQQLNPALPSKECDNRAFLVLTNCLGAWLMLSRSRPDLPQAPKQDLKQLLLSHIRHICKP